MPDRINLTKSVIDALPLPEKGKREYHHDARARGLTICVTWTGAKTWYVSRWAAGKSQRIRLGEYPGMALEAARKRAEEIGALIARGEDPSAPLRKRREEPTLGEVFDWWVEYHGRPSRRSYERYVDRFENGAGHLRNQPISKITRSLLRDLHAKVGKKHGPVSANRLIQTISAVLGKAITHEKIDGPNPAKGIELFKELSRDRRLTASEVGPLMAAIEQETNHNLRDLVLLALYTGARKSNVLAMRWDEIDFKARTWRIPLTKNGKPQVVPLETPELALLDVRRKVIKSPWVFPGNAEDDKPMGFPERGWMRMKKRAQEAGAGEGILTLRLHDLRRTLGSWMVDTGASLPVIGQALNHQDPSTTAIYARIDLAPVREAKLRAIAALGEAAGKQLAPVDEVSRRRAMRAASVRRLTGRT